MPIRVHLHSAILFLIPLWVTAVVWADSAPLAAAFAITSRSGRYVFKMVPELSPDAPARGEALEILPDGGFKPLWITTGWYGRQIYLSEDGRTLVRVTPRHSGRTVSATDLAVAFYFDGVLARAYHTADLVKKTEIVRYDATGYSWVAPTWLAITGSNSANGTHRVERDAEAEPFLDSAGIFRIKTIDQIIYQFEASTGRLVKRTLP